MFMVFSDPNKIIYASTKRLSIIDTAISEAQSTLLASQVASSLGIYPLTLEGDAINIDHTCYSTTTSLS